MLKNNPGEALIKKHEGCKLVAYPDPCSDLAKACIKAKISIYDNGYLKLQDWEKYDAKPWTIGWGFAIVRIYPGMTWTQESADWALEIFIDKLLRDIAFQIDKQSFMAEEYHKLNENQIGAILDFTYNCGIGNLLHILLNGGFEKFPETIQRYIHDKHGNEVAALINRRREEAELFNK